MTELGPPNINRWFNVILINTFGAIWDRRNMCRFQDNRIPCKTSINTIISSVSFSVNYTTIVASTSMSDFMILKSFFVKIHPPNAPEIKEMMWFPLVNSWIKYNTKGFAHYRHYYFYWVRSRERLDSSLAWIWFPACQLGFTPSKIIFWNLYNCWQNCYDLLRNMTFSVLTLTKKKIVVLINGGLVFPHNL